MAPGKGAHGNSTFLVSHQETPLYSPASNRVLAFSVPQELAADLAQITFDYPFRIPPYFALIIRAIGVLEGIALVRASGGTAGSRVGSKRLAAYKQAVASQCAGWFARFATMKQQPLPPLVLLTGG